MTNIGLATNMLSKKKESPLVDIIKKENDLYLQEINDLEKLLKLTVESKKIKLENSIRYTQVYSLNNVSQSNNEILEDLNAFEETKKEST